MSKTNPQKPWPHQSQDEDTVEAFLRNPGVTVPAKVRLAFRRLSSCAHNCKHQGCPRQTGAHSKAAQALSANKDTPNREALTHDRQGGTTTEPVRVAGIPDEPVSDDQDGGKA